MTQKDDKIPRVLYRMSHGLRQKCPFYGIATQRASPEAALSYFISPFVKRPLVRKSAGVFKIELVSKECHSPWCSLRKIFQEGAKKPNGT